MTTHDPARANPPPIDPATRTRIEAATFRTLRRHLLEVRPEVQNIDLMNLAGFCRNCLARWMGEAAAEHGIPLDKAQARALFYGMPYQDWIAAHQTPASPEQQAAFARATRPDDASV